MLIPFTIFAIASMMFGVGLLQHIIMCRKETEIFNDYILLNRILYKDWLEEFKRVNSEETYSCERLEFIHEKIEENTNQYFRKSKFKKELNESS